MNNIITELGEVVTIAEAARMLQITRVTLYSWIKKGKLVDTGILGQYRVVKVSEIRRLQEEK